MVRTFTTDVGRFRKGDVRDYPKQVWDGIAKSAKRSINSFSEGIKTFNNADRKKKRR